MDNNLQHYTSAQINCEWLINRLNQQTQRWVSGVKPSEASQIVTSPMETRLSPIAEMEAESQTSWSTTIPYVSRTTSKWVWSDTQPERQTIATTLTTAELPKTIPTTLKPPEIALTQTKLWESTLGYDRPIVYTFQTYHWEPRNWLTAVQCVIYFRSCGWRHVL